MKKRKTAKSLYVRLLTITLLPVMFLMVLVIAIGVRSFTRALDEEVRHSLMDLGETILTMYDKLYPGDYATVTKEDGLYLLKGEHVLNGDYSIVDSIKENTGVDITLFYEEVRVITTLKDEQDKRLIGTNASTIIQKDVLETGRDVFYPSVQIGENAYYAYYAPLINENGSTVGMIFVGKPVATVRRMLYKTILPLVIVGLLALLVIGVLILRFSNELMAVITKIEDFLAKVAKGDLNENLDYIVTKREDELGELGKHALKMQKSLRDLVEKDALTGLINRRSADKKLKALQRDKYEIGTSFCLAIGDIDFFKKVNDTYGHEWGDVVLMKVAEILRNKSVGKGFAARWGGEEFLLVFTGKNLLESRGILESVLSEIRALEIFYEDETIIKLTMSFGVCEGEGEDLDAIIREADNRLYYAKEHGRNRIVSTPVTETKE